MTGVSCHCCQTISSEDSLSKRSVAIWAAVTYLRQPELRPMSSMVRELGLGALSLSKGFLSHLLWEAVSRNILFSRGKDVLALSTNDYQGCPN